MATKSHRKKNRAKITTEQTRETRRAGRYLRHRPPFVYRRNNAAVPGTGSMEMTPYKINTLFGYHKEYNPQQFKSTTQAEPDGMDAIDVALGGF